MLKELLRAIGARISELYPEYPVIVEQLEQLPAHDGIFLVRPGTITNDLMTTPRRRLTVQVFITYIPGRGAPYAAGTDIIPDLIETLEIIETDNSGTVTGEANGATITDDVWLIDMTYTVYLENTPTPGDLMEELTLDT